MNKAGSISTILPEITYGPPVVLTWKTVFNADFSGTPLTITLDGLINPRSFTTSSSFQIVTYDSSGNPIEYADTGLTVTMTTMSTLDTFRVEPVSLVNGATTDYKVTVVAKTPYEDGDKVIFTFPPEISYAATPVCAGGVLTTTVTCSTAGNQVTATITAFSATIN